MNNEYIKIELYCYKGNTHKLSYPLPETRNGIPDELRGMKQLGYSSYKGEPECCLIPADLELRIFRSVAFGGIDSARSYGRLRIDASDYTPLTLTS